MSAQHSPPNYPCEGCTPEQSSAPAKNVGDHDLLIQVVNDVKWMREKMEKDCEDQADIKKRVESLETFRTRVYSGAGLAAFISSLIGGSWFLDLWPRP